jgi:hypothetical protein
MNEKPILFSGPMVRAILDGRKTMTRRAVKLREREDAHEGNDGTLHAVQDHGCHVTERVIACPYGKTGDRLWVRETCYRWTGCGRAPSRFACIGGPQICYADDPEFGTDAQSQSANAYSCVVTVPSIHMPRWASRLTLEVTAVRVERLQAISEADARAEGIDRRMDGPDEEYSGAPGKWGWNPVTAFRHLWDAINAGRGYPWESNPWVWVVAFKLVENRA